MGIGNEVDGFEFFIFGGKNSNLIFVDGEDNEFEVKDLGMKNLNFGESDFKFMNVFVSGIEDGNNVLSFSFLEDLGGEFLVNNFIVVYNLIVEGDILVNDMRRVDEFLKEGKMGEIVMEGILLMLIFYDILYGLIF